MANPNPHHQPTPWDTIPQARRDTAERVLTTKQLQVLRHRINGHDYRTIADALDVTEPTVRDHYQAAIRKLEQHYRKDTMPATKTDLQGPLNAICQRLGLNPKSVASLTLKPGKATAIVCTLDDNGSRHLDSTGTEVLSETIEFDITT